MKSNHLVEARYNMTLAEHRFLSLLLAQVRPDHRPIDKLYYVKASEFSQVYGVDISDAYKQLRNATTGIITRLVYSDVLAIDLIDRCVWVERVQYFNKHGMAAAQFPKTIARHIHRVDGNFTPYYLEDVRKFGSRYAFRLFEHIVRFDDTGMFVVKLEKFRNMFMLEDRYPDFTDLKRRVINPAIDEINLHTKYRVNFDSYRKRASGVVLMFYIAFDQEAPGDVADVTEDAGAGDAQPAVAAGGIEDFRGIYL